MGRCILNIDEQLRSGRFTFRTNNPEVIPTPAFVKDFLGVDNLTKQQYELINSTEKFLWINGPAGAGKTVVLLGKILQLVRSSEHNKVVLFNQAVSEDRTSSERNHRILESAGVKHVFLVVEVMLGEPSELYRKISSHILDYQVVIVVMLGFQNSYEAQLRKSPGDWLQILFASLRGINVFFDDMQVILSWYGVVWELYRLIEILPRLSNTHYVWVACDRIQSIIDSTGKDYTLRHNKDFANFFKDKSSSHQLVSLSKNLRNTTNLSSTLSIIRNQIIELSDYESEFKNNIFPLQAPGHYIHGPKSIIHVLQNFNKELIYDIFTKEWDILLSDNMKDNTDVGIIYCNGDIDTLSLVEHITDGILRSYTIIPKLLNATYSMEWPAVIVLQTLRDHQHETLMRAMRMEGNVEQFSTDFGNLYLAMSRARVRCTVIMFPMEGLIFDDFHRMKDLLDKLEDSVEIRRYPLTPASYTPRSFIRRRSIADYTFEKFPRCKQYFDDY